MVSETAFAFGLSLSSLTHSWVSFHFYIPFHIFDSGVKRAELRKIQRQRKWEEEAEEAKEARDVDAEEGSGRAKDRERAGRGRAKLRTREDEIQIEQQQYQEEREKRKRERERAAESRKKKRKRAKLHTKRVLSNAPKSRRTFIPEDNLASPLLRVQSKSSEKKRARTKNSNGGCCMRLQLDDYVPLQMDVIKLQNLLLLRV